MAGPAFKHRFFCSRVEPLHLPGLPQGWPEGAEGPGQVWVDDEGGGGGWGFGAPPQPPEEGGGRFRSSAATYLGRRPERGEDEGLRAGPAEGGRPSVSHQGPKPINPPLLMRESPVFSPLSPLKNVGATDQAQREEERAPCRPSPSALPLGLPTAHRLLRPVPTSSAPVSLPAATETQSPQTTPVNLPPPRRSKALKLNSLSNAVTLEGAFMDSTGIMI